MSPVAAVVTDGEGVGTGPRSHRPVLVGEVLEMLAPLPGGLAVDATVGAGGHAQAILENFPQARVLGIDRDPEAVDLARRRLAKFGARARIIQANFRNLDAVLRDEGAIAAAVLFDLGTSDMQLGDPMRGFSFNLEGPLDMRMGPDASHTAETLLHRIREEELMDLIRKYGEDWNAARIARRLVAARSRGGLRTTADLARIVTGACRRVPQRAGKKRTHPATRTFQAIRIAVNDELGALAEALPQALGVLRPGGRLAVISFHSLEDRLVKQFFARESRDCICPPEVATCRCGHVRRLMTLTRKPMMAGPGEVSGNPSSRSARLRVAERM